MNEIIARLKESRQIQAATELLESQGYTVTRLEEGEGDNLSEDQISLNPKNDKDKLDSISSRPMKHLRPFKQEDWYAWGGCTPLPSGNDPYIYEDDDYILLVTSDSDDPKDVTEDTDVSVEIYFDNPGDKDGDLAHTYSLTGKESEMLQKADEIAEKLSQGYDLRKLARQYNMTYTEL